MNTLYLTPSSFNFVAQILIAVSTCVLLGLRIKANSPSTNKAMVFITLVFGLLTVLSSIFFFESAFLTSPRILIVYAANAVLALMLIFLLLFAYEFPEPYKQNKFESRFLIGSAVLYFFLEFGFMVFRYHMLIKYQSIYYRPVYASYGMLFVLLSIPFAFIRQTITTDLRKDMHGWKNVFRKIWKPVGENARTSRRFVLIFLLAFSVGMFNAFFSHYIYSSIASTGILIFLWLFISNYLLYLPKQRLQEKVFIPFLAIYFLILGVIVLIVSQVFIKAYRPPLTAEQSFRFKPSIRGGYELTEIPFSFSEEFGENISLDGYSTYHILFSFPFYDRTYHDLYISKQGMISLGESFWFPNIENKSITTPIIFPLLLDLDTYSKTLPNEKSGLYINNKNNLTVTWYQLKSKNGDIFSFQVILYTNGTIDLNYAHIPPTITYQINQQASSAPWMRGITNGQAENLHIAQCDFSEINTCDQNALIENFYFAYRKYQSSFIVPFLMISLIGSIIVFAALFFHLKYSIWTPLETLAVGIKNLEDGNFSLKVPVKHDDEIGALSKAFNDLSGRLLVLINSSEMRFQQLFEYQPDFCYIVSHEGIILDVNPAALKILGYSLSECLGKPVTEIYAPEYQETVKMLMKTWQNVGILQNERLAIISKQGERHEISLTIGAQKDGSGTFTRSIHIQRDIAPQKELEGAIAELSAMHTRQKLARNLHDSMTQSLDSVIISAESAQHLHQHENTIGLKKALALIEDAARQARKELRLLLFELHFQPKFNIQLIDSLQTRINMVEMRLGFNISFTYTGLEYLPREWDLELFYIASEALNNILKHAQANTISVHVNATDQMVRMSIVDDGVGFNVSDQDFQYGMGIENMKHRASNLGGKLSITSIPNKRTEVKLIIER